MQKKKSYKIEYAPTVKKDFKKIGRVNTFQIMNKLSFYSRQENPLIFSSKIIGFKNRYRWRIGDYRVIFCKNEKTKELTILLITAIKKRGEAYRD